MAAAGVYKSDVQKARETLLAQGTYPSIDAVRIALGNTGSKSTIHRYLKELEAEDGEDPHKMVSVSESITDLVERLAVRLQDEARQEVADAQQRFSVKEREINARAADLEAQLVSATNQLRETGRLLEQERNALAKTDKMLQEKRTELAREAQRAADLELRVEENERHSSSLEQQHAHAREALEHFRESARQQRLDLQQRHESELQTAQAELRAARQTLVGKQEEITRLTGELNRLFVELTHQRTATDQALTQIKAMEGRLSELADENSSLLAERETLKGETSSYRTKIDELVADLFQSRDREGRLAKNLGEAEGKLITQSSLAAQLQEFLQAARHVAANNDRAST